MDLPRIVIDLKKIENNCRVVVESCNNRGINVTGITKSFCGETKIAEVLRKGGVTYLGDARLDNLKNLQSIDIPKILIRLPMKSTAEKVVELADISLNSELDTIRELNFHAKRKEKLHGIILMLELGDLREGILEENLENFVKEILPLKNIKIMGLGANFTCYGGVIPDSKNLSKLSETAQKLNEKFQMNLEIISGGNSSSYYMLQKEKFPEGINNLRIGEAILLGRETSYGERIQGTTDETFTLQAEIVEIKDKPSVPEGNIGLDAFGHKPEFVDRGMRKRAILAVGRQDVDPEGMIPKDDGIIILGASSDHLIIDVTDCETNYHVGELIEFKLTYSALLKLMTSKYIKKHYLD